MKDPQVSGKTVISVVIPLYNEENNVGPLVERLESVLGRLGCDWEFVFALDPSPDRTREKILALIDAGHRIRLITFSRRIGKPLSLMAGLDHSRGDACVIIDADLQDPPEFIEEMVKKWREGYEVVIPQRVSRKGESLLYLKAAEAFYWLFGKVAEVSVPTNTGDFRLLDARVVREMCRFRERHGFLRGITAAAGFRHRGDSVPSGSSFFRKNADSVVGGGEHRPGRSCAFFSHRGEDDFHPWLDSHRPGSGRCCDMGFSGPVWWVFLRHGRS